LIFFNAYSSLFCVLVFLPGRLIFISILSYQQLPVFHTIKPGGHIVYRNKPVFNYPVISPVNRAFKNRKVLLLSAIKYIDAIGKKKMGKNKKAPNKSGLQNNMAFISKTKGPAQN
jgi:hypothetical protein